jgi:hypothetical protein
VFSCAGATFWFPGISDPVGQGSGQLDELSVWVGIGGVFNSRYLWQAGVEIWQRTSTTGGSTEFQTFDEGAEPLHPDYIYNAGANTSSLPTTFSVNICSYPNGQNTYSVGTWYSSSGHTNWFNGSTGVGNFYANLSSVDWVVEDATSAAGRYAMPSFNELAVSRGSWTDQNGSSTGFLPGTGAFMLTGTSCGACGTQYAFPTTLYTTYSEFSIVDPGNSDS